MENDKRILEAALRKDPVCFIMKAQMTLQPNKPLIMGQHIEAIAWHLHLCMTGQINRLIINVPPRYLKSVCASIAFVAFILGHDPEKRIICASYGEDLAAKLSRDCRTIMQSLFYRELFPHTRISPEKNTEMRFETTLRGFRHATSIGGGVTGMGADYMIIDDPIKADDALSESKRKEVRDRFDNTLYSRLDSKQDGCIIVIMQRLHQGDLTGHLLEKGGWTHLNLPATAEIEEKIQIGPDRFFYRSPGGVLLPAYESAADLAETKRIMGSFAYAGQYQQRPIPEEGEILKLEWFGTYDVAPPFKNGERIVQSWDMASKDGEMNDYSVCTTFQIKGNNYYIIDIFRAKMLFPELKKAAYAEAAKYKIVEVIIEDTGHGTALYQELKKAPGPTMDIIRAIIPQGTKLMRAAAQSALIEARRVWLPRQAPWLRTLQDEILQFPKGRYDDQVDSIVQFLKWENGPKNTIREIHLDGI